MLNMVVMNMDNNSDNGNMVMRGNPSSPHHNHFSMQQGGESLLVAPKLHYQCDNEGESLITTSQPFFNVTRRENPSSSRQNSIINMTMRGIPHRHIMTIF